MIRAVGLLMDIKVDIDPNLVMPIGISTKTQGESEINEMKKTVIKANNEILDEKKDLFERCNFDMLDRLQINGHILQLRNEFDAKKIEDLVIKINKIIDRSIIMEFMN